MAFSNASSISTVEKSFLILRYVYNLIKLIKKFEQQLREIWIKIYFFLEQFREILIMINFFLNSFCILFMYDDNLFLKLAYQRLYLLIFYSVRCTHAQQLQFIEHICLHIQNSPVLSRPLHWITTVWRRTSKGNICVSTGAKIKN